MDRTITIKLSDDVYKALNRRVDADHISQFIEDLLRPLVVAGDDLAKAYLEMAADTLREQEVLDWIEAYPDDALE